MACDKPLDTSIHTLILNITDQCNLDCIYCSRRASRSEPKDMPFETPVLKEDIQFFIKNKSFSLPFHPPYMANKGNYIASLGKVVRWYYSTQAPGPIVYASNGNTVSLSYGARPCMNLPEQFPDDIDYAWYTSKAEAMLKDIGFYALT